MEVAATFIVGNDGFFGTIEFQTLTLGTFTDFGDIVESEHHILRRHGDRSTIGRIENIVALKHQNLCFKDSLVAQGKVNSHLVTVEVGVERCTSQWVQLNGFTLDEFRLEGLNTQTVQCWSTVQEHGVTLHHVFQDVPDNWFAAVNNALGTLHSLHNAALNELADDEWLVELCSHELRKTTFAHFQFRTNHDNRTC